MSNYASNERMYREQYGKKVAEINLQIRTLTDRMRKHGDTMRRTSMVDWGYVGDLRHISDSLQDILNFLDNK